jgi:hypothetical protein
LLSLFFDSKKFKIQIKLIMKKLVIAFCAMLSLTAISHAQDGTAARVRSQSNEMKEDGQGKDNFGMSADQEAKFKAIRQAHQEAVKKVEMDKSLAADAKTAQINALKSKYEADVKGVMNAEQFAKWSDMRAKRDARKSERMKDHKDKMDNDKEDEKTGGVKPEKEKVKDRGGKIKKDNVPVPGSN